MTVDMFVSAFIDTGQSITFSKRAWTLFKIVSQGRKRPFYQERLAVWLWCQPSIGSSEPNSPARNTCKFGCTTCCDLFLVVTLFGASWRPEQQADPWNHTFSVHHSEPMQRELDTAEALTLFRQSRHNLCLRLEERSIRENISLDSRRGPVPVSKLKSFCTLSLLESVVSACC